MKHQEKDQKKRFRDSNIKFIGMDAQKWSEELSNSLCDEYELPILFPGLLNLLRCSGDVLLLKKKLTNENAIVVHDKVVNFVSAQLKKVSQHQNLQPEESWGTFRVNMIRIFQYEMWFGVH
jgi:hypothetical protein